MVSTGDISFYIKLIDANNSQKIRVTVKICQDSTVDLVEIVTYLKDIGSVEDGQVIELQEKDESFTLEGKVPLKGYNFLHYDIWRENLLVLRASSDEQKPNLIDKKIVKAKVSEVKEDKIEEQKFVPQKQKIIHKIQVHQNHEKLTHKLSKKKERQLYEILKMIKDFNKRVNTRTSKKEKNITKIKQEVAQEIGESVQTIYYYIQDIQKGKSYLFNFKQHKYQKVSSLQHYNKNFETIVTQQIDWYRNKENMDVSEIMTKSDEIIFQIKHQLANMNHRNCCVNGPLQVKQETAEEGSTEENSEENNSQTQQQIVLLQKQRNFSLKEQIIKILEKKIGKQVVCQLSQRNFQLTHK